MSTGQEKVQEIFDGSAAIQALVETFAGKPAIWFDIIVPARFKGHECINYYDIGGQDGSLEYGDFVYTINCRSKTHKKAIALQKTVFDTFNRHNTLTGRGLFVCFSYPAIPPIDELDDYNAPIEIRIKTTL